MVRNNNNFGGLNEKSDEYQVKNKAQNIIDNNPSEELYKDNELFPRDKIK